LKMETIVSPKRRDNSPTPGGDILEDVEDVDFLTPNIDLTAHF
jgi:hypothetical protein